MPSPRRISDNLWLLPDTCNVYLVRDGQRGVLIDFGAGAGLDHLAAIGVTEPPPVVVTHHHRDQVQGLGRAVAAGCEVWVPPVERDLIAAVDEHWQARPIALDYDVRQDRFSLLDSVTVTGTVPEYRARRFGPIELTTLPTPGHTMGSVSYLADVDGRSVAFIGDLMYGAGKVWSLASTMWLYGEIPGVGATILSLLALRARKPDLLLPSHGEPITDPLPAIDRTIAELRRMLEFRGASVELDEWIEHPYVSLTPHLLHNRTATAFSYVLISRSGKALLLDFGYDFELGMPWAAHDRAARRPWLHSLEALRSDHGVTDIDVVIPTHYHDDHVAGINLLREVEGTRLWAPSNFADVLERPARYDLPCLWHDPIPVDRVLPVGETVRWEEYELGVHDLPGHTAFAAAISLEVDGTRVVFTGDQQDMNWGRQPRPERLNYIYPNRVALGDFVKSAELYARLDPQLMIGGHWAPRWVAPDYLEMLSAHGRLMDELHRSLLPLDDVDLGLEGFAARIEPYRSEMEAGALLQLDVWVRNPYPQADEALVRIVTPDGWTVDPAERRLRLDGRAEATLRFTVTPAPRPVRRARIAADLSIGERRLGQQAEALVTVC